MTIIHSSHSSDVIARDAFFRELGETVVPDDVQGTILIPPGDSRSQKHPAGSFKQPHCNANLPSKKTDTAEKR